jgi:hypothetical protein
MNFGWTGLSFNDIKNKKMIFCFLLFKYQMANINSMTINNIIDFIRDELYIDNNNQIIKYDYNFKGNIIDFNNMGDNYINIFKDKFNSAENINNSEVIINYNNLSFNIKYTIDNNDIYWNIIIFNI